MMDEVVANTEIICFNEQIFEWLSKKSMLKKRSADLKDILRPIIYCLPQDDADACNWSTDIFLLCSWLKLVRKNGEIEASTLCSAVRKFCEVSVKKINKRWALHIEYVKLLSAVSFLDNVEKVKSISLLKELQENARKDKSEQASVLQVHLCEYFLYHGAPDFVECLLRQLFTLDLARHWNTIEFGTEYFEFLLRNEACLATYKNRPLERYAPAIFRIFIWQPKLHLMRFCQLFPALLSSDNAFELFDSVLRLPYTAMALTVDGERSSFKQRSQIRRVLEDPANGHFTSYLLRLELDNGKTSLTESYYKQLPASTIHTEAVPVLLKLCFQSIIGNCSNAVAESVALAAFESIQLTSCDDSWKEILHDGLLQLLHAYPSIRDSMFLRANEFVGCCQNRALSEELFLSCCWLIGEHCKTAKETVLANSFEVIESALCDIQMGKKDKNYPRSLTIMTVALAKIGVARGPFWINEVKDTCDIISETLTAHNEAQRCIRDLSFLLSFPRVASILCLEQPTADYGEWGRTQIFTKMTVKSI